MTLAMFPIVLWERNHSFVFWLLYNSLIAQRENEQDVRKKYSSTFFFLKTWPLKCVCNAVSSESRLLSCLNMRCLPLHHHLCSFRNHHRFPFHYVPHILKLQSVTFLFKIYKIYIINKYTMNPFSKPCFWLVLNHYGTPIISVYIQTI